MDQRHLLGDAYRTAVRALDAAPLSLLGCPVMSFGPIVRTGVESWLPRVRSCP